jgi:hypothetical protein
MQITHSHSPSPRSTQIRIRTCFPGHPIVARVPLSPKHPSPSCALEDCWCCTGKDVRYCCFVCAKISSACLFAVSRIVEENPTVSVLASCSAAESGQIFCLILYSKYGSGPGPVSGRSGNSISGSFTAVSACTVAYFGVVIVKARETACDIRSFSMGLGKGAVCNLPR